MSSRAEDHTSRSLDRGAAAGPSLSVLGILAISVWLGLAAGALQLLVTAFAVLRPQPAWPGFLRVTPHIWWLTPFTSALIASAAGVAAAAVAVGAARFARPLPVRLTLSMLTLPVAVLAAFQFRSSVDERALIVLGLGAGYQAAAWLTPRADGLLRLVRRTMTPAILGVALIAVSVMVPTRLVERRAAAALASPPADAVNVLLVVMDTVRASDVDLNTPATATPTLAAIARAGVRFDHAVSSASWTLPSIGTMFTGRLPRELFFRGETPLNASSPLPGDYPTMAEVLRDRGYLTAGFVANTMYGSREHGLDRGFVHYEDYQLSAESLAAATELSKRGYIKLRNLLNPEARDQLLERKSARDVSSAFLGWIDRQERRPFFAFLNYFDAHDPYVPPRRFRPTDTPPPFSPRIDPMFRYTPVQATRLHAAYRANVAYIDEQIGVVLNGLRQRDLLRNTLVVVTSDHGEHFGEHGIMSHGNSLYRPLLAVPLVMMFEGRLPSGRVVDQAVTLKNLPATMLDVLGQGDARIPGTALVMGSGIGDVSQHGEAALSDEMIGVERHKWAPAAWPVSRGAMRSVIADRYHYIRDGAGREELYDFERDPDERQDLAETAEGQAALARFRALADAPDQDRPSAARRR